VQLVYKGTVLRRTKLYGNKNKDFGLLFWIHLILILFAYFSPLWLDWKVILITAIGLQVYYSIRGGCDITFWELGNDTDTTFVWYYLKKIFPKLPQKKTKFFIRIILPILLVLISFLTQYFYLYQPFVSF
jgi:hypothetical protein